MASAEAAIRSIADRFIASYPPEVARVLEQEPVAEVARFIEGLAPERAAALLECLTPSMAGPVLEELGTEAAVRVLEEADPARAAALLARFDSEARDRLLARLSPRLSQEIAELIAYPPDSAGHLMNPRVMAFRPEDTVEHVLSRLRAVRERRIQDVFLIDEQGHLAGAVALQDLALAGPDERLDGLVRRAPALVQATSPRDEVMAELERARGGSLAVVAFDGRLLGVLRQAELIEAAQQEATAELVTMVGAGKDERALSPPWFAISKRLPWLQINLVTAFLAAAVVGLFEGTIARYTALAVLLPVVAGQSGNTGAQALAVTMRGLALREVRARQWLRVSGKEIVVGAANGVAVAATTALAVYGWSRSAGLSLVIATSMVISMTAAGLSGAGIPMLLTAFRQDPAQSSSILLTTITDVVGFFSFLGIATLLSFMLEGI